MSDYIDKIKKGEEEFDIHDVRVDSLTPGTKLYEHEITCTGGAYCKVKFINNISAPYTNIAELFNTTSSIIGKITGTYGSSYPQKTAIVAYFGLYSAKPQATPGNDPLLDFSVLRLGGSNIEIATLTFTIDKTTGTVSAGTEQIYNLGTISSDTVTPL